MGRSRRKRLPSEPVLVDIESLSPDGRGVARIDGKVLFVDLALPGERVQARYTRRLRRHDEAVAIEIIEPSPDRVAARCPHFGLCGGCALQHLSSGAQLRHKEQALLDQLRHLGGVTPERVLPPLEGPVWGYRHKARLGVKYVAGKGRVLVGFRERRSPYVADLGRCEVLIPAVGERIEALARLIDGLEARASIPQIEVAAGDDAVTLVLRHLVELGAADRARLTEFAREQGLQLQLQPGGTDSVVELWPPTQRLGYGLPAAAVDFEFRATDFTQVNRLLNRSLVERAIDLLDPGPTDRVLDLFCGLGNFSLPLARRSREVLGAEGDAAMSERARRNAERNGIANLRFETIDLDRQLQGAGWLDETWDLVLLDPPRSGAREVVESLGRLAPRRVLYVSCNPATLARDAGILVASRGFRLAAAGVVDMFPHTAHVESMALFDAV